MHKNRAVWKCLCDCDNKVNVISCNLRGGKTKSCGCLKKMKGRHWKWSEESKKKFSEKCKGRKVSEITKKKISEANSGSKHPLYGKHHTKKTREKQSRAKKDFYANGGLSPNLGKHPTIETRIKQSKSHLNHFPSLATRKKKSEAMIGSR